MNKNKLGWYKGDCVAYPGSHMQDLVCITTSFIYVWHKQFSGSRWIFNYRYPGGIEAFNNLPSISDDKIPNYVKFYLIKERVQGR